MPDWLQVVDVPSIDGCFDRAASPSRQFGELIPVAAVKRGLSFGQIGQRSGKVQQRLIPVHRFAIGLGFRMGFTKQVLEHFNLRRTASS
jgi:hypothetical protein